MLDELSKTIKAQLYERASSPLLGSFLVSWAGWNYKFILTLLSSLPLQDKIAYIETHLYPSAEAVGRIGIAYPLLTARGLIFIYPIPAKYVYKYWRTKQRELKEVQQRIDDETPLTREEARALRKEALNVSLEYESQLEARRSELSHLRELLAAAQQRRPPLKGERDL